MDNSLSYYSGNKMTSTLPAPILALVGTTLPLADVASAVAACAARAGDGDRAAAATFAAESGTLAHGWTRSDLGSPAAAADTTEAGPAAWDKWVALINKTAEPSQFAIILPPPAGAPLAQTTGTGRSVWAALPGGALLRVTTRPAGSDLAHIIAADIFAADKTEPADSAAILAENLRAPHFDEADDHWLLNLAMPGPAVLARLTGGKITLRPVGRREPSAVAEGRHLLPTVAATLRPAVEARRVRKAAEAAEAKQEGVLADVLGRPMPRR